MSVTTSEAYSLLQSRGEILLYRGCKGMCRWIVSLFHERKKLLWLFFSKKKIISKGSKWKKKKLLGGKKGNFLVWKEGPILEEKSYAVSLLEDRFCSGVSFKPQWPYDRTDISNSSCTTSYEIIVSNPRPPRLQCPRFLVDRMVLPLRVVGELSLVLSVKQLSHDIQALQFADVTRNTFNPIAKRTSPALQDSLTLT